MPDQPYGPDNPHPFSTIRTELIWEGKYDEYGNRREVDIAGAAMPLQKIETVDEPASRAMIQGTLFDPLKAHRDDFRNMLIWGDNKLVMSSLLKEYKGKIDLIYIDPPFDVGADFTMDVPVGEEKDQIEKDQSTLEMVAYRDMWGKGTDSYLQMMYERLSIMHQLLSPTGTIYVHCDWRVNSLIRCLLDDIFGSNLLNQITWQKIRTTKAQTLGFGNVQDTIWVYSKTDKPIFHNQYTEFDPKYIKSHYKPEEGTGRLYRTVSMLQKGSGPARNFGGMILEPPPGRHWIWSQERIDSAMSADRIVFTSNGRPEKIQYLDEMKGDVVDDIWDDIFPINSQAAESLGYPTQKPESLLTRIINASSNEGDIVADFFVGSGTLAAVAEKLGRKWIAVDLGRFAIHTSRKRMIELQRELHAKHQPYRSFDVYNLGRYERQWWQKEALEGADEEHRRVVLEFYRAEQLAESPSPLLHGRKAGAFVHVDSIDSIFTRQEARAVALAAKAAGGREVNCLSWEFEMDLRMNCDALEKELGVRIKLIPIPREIMERNRKEPPPFLEVATLTAEPVVKTLKDKKVADIKLTKFLPSLSEVPVKELEALRERAVQSGFDFIDFWAVDFDYHHDKPFNHHWQAFRTRQDRSLPTVSNLRYEYPEPGTYTACVKVVDVFGVDTSITVEVTI